MHGDSGVIGDVGTFKDPKQLMRDTLEAKYRQGFEDGYAAAAQEIAGMAGIGVGSVDLTPQN